MNNVVVHDTLECFVNDTDNSKTYFFGLTDKGNVTQSVTQEVIRSGIGAKVAAVLNSEKNLEFTITSTFHNDDIIAIQSGTEFGEDTIRVQSTIAGTLTSGAIALSATPVADSVIVMDKFGKTYVSSYAAGSVTVTGGTDGNIYTVIYSEDVTGQILDLDSTAFPINYKVQLHGIGYDPDTNQVVCDIYWLFDKAMPDGAINFNGAKSTNATEDVRFTAQTPIGSNSYGKYVVVPRA
jgi:hypothetical protein